MAEDKKPGPPAENYKVEQEFKRQGQGHQDDTPGMEKLEEAEAAAPDRLADTSNGKKAVQPPPEK